MGTEKQSGRKSDIGVMDRDDHKIEKPKKFKVVFHNDDYTPMYFVVYLLKEIFHKPEDEAQRLMLDVHEKGRGIAGVFSKEIADTKCNMCVKLSRTMGFPLMATAEPE